MKPHQLDDGVSGLLHNFILVKNRTFFTIETKPSLPSFGSRLTGTAISVEVLQVVTSSTAVIAIIAVVKIKFLRLR